MIFSKFDAIWYIPEMATMYNEWIDLCEASQNAKVQAFNHNNVDTQTALTVVHNELLRLTLKMTRRYADLKRASELPLPEKCS